jgi:hypothetical protein
MRILKAITHGQWVACVCALTGCTELSAAEGSSASAYAAGSGAVASPSTGHGGGLAALAPTVVPGDWTYVGPLTSRTGPAALDPTLGINGTDMGVSFPHDGKLYFLFGDSWTANPNRNTLQGLDTLASTQLAPPESGTVPALSWVRVGEGQAVKPFTLSGYKALKEMSVPVEAVSVGDETYIFYYNSTGRVQEGNPPIRSILAKANASDLTTLTPVDERQSAKFLSVSALRDGADVYIYGAAPYRQGHLHLAKVSEADFPKRDSWAYYTADGSWLTGENNAAPIFPEEDRESDAPCIGEISVRKYESLYFMTYNCGKDLSHYVQLRVAERPEGPWSKPATLLRNTDAYGVFVHADPAETGSDDGLGESGLFSTILRLPRTQGDVYGPYLIPEWFTQNESGQYEIAYTLSSWNPYQVHLLRTKVSIELP